MDPEVQKELQVERIVSVSWAQRRKALHLCFDITSAADVSVVLAEDGQELTFRCCDAEFNVYKVRVMLYSSVLPLTTSPRVLIRDVRIVLRKKVHIEWRRLTLDTSKMLRQLVTYNWNLDHTLPEDNDECHLSTPDSSSSECLCDEKEVYEAMQGKAADVARDTSCIQDLDVVPKPLQPRRSMRVAPKPSGYSLLTLIAVSLVVAMVSIIVTAVVK